MTVKKYGQPDTPEEWDPAGQEQEVIWSTDDPHGRIKVESVGPVDDPDITEGADLKTLTDGQANQLQAHARSGLELIDALEEQASHDEEITGFTPTQGGVLFEHEGEGNGGTELG